MNLVQAIIIAIVEGLTEFLPISSTAHIEFTMPLVGVDQKLPFAQLYAVVIQLAAIFSVVVIYWKKFFDFKHFSFYLKLIVAVAPALVFGGLAKKYIDQAMGNLTTIAIVMVAGGIVLLFVDKLFRRNVIDREESISYPKALTIGCYQVLSVIFPGLSRSAATIVGGMSQHLTRRLAAEFSFFLAVPTMIAASAKSFLDVYEKHPEALVKENYTTLGVGCIVSFAVALIAVKFFINYLQKHGFRAFGFYRILIGLTFLALIVWGGLGK